MTHDEAPAGTGATPIITDPANTSTVLQPVIQVMPPLTADEYAALEASIAEHGVMTVIVVDENGVIIDGHHREEIALKLGVFCPRRTVRDKTDEQKLAMALTLNIDRRHLTREQRRELLGTSIKAEPRASDREHGRRTGTDHKTAAKARAEMEGRGEIPHTDTRTDATGREQPVSKPKADDSQAKSSHNGSNGSNPQPPPPRLVGLKGTITRADFDLVRSCLHPDSRLSVTPEKLARAFRVFNGSVKL